jgi:hypothetical protein
MAGSRGRPAAQTGANSGFRYGKAKSAASEELERGFGR